MSSQACVGIVANPASGRDIRRLVAGASVFGNPDKAAMVLRALHGLATAGVGRVLMMPAGDGLSSTLARHLTGRHATAPDVEVLDMHLTGTAEDTTRAVERMCAEGVAALIVLGGDGTHRVVAKACGEIPMCALSTGTNNVFPEMREATIAGLAVGLVATGRVDCAVAHVREAALRVEREHGAPDLALVDVAVTASPFAGARALWRTEDLTDLVVAFADPSAVGLSSVAALLDPLPRGSGRGLHVRFAADATEARWTFRAPIAPGMVAPVAVAAHRRLAMGDQVALPPGVGALSLDGEREIERRPGERVSVKLVPGPRRIDVDAVMAEAAARNATHTLP